MSFPNVVLRLSLVAAFAAAAVVAAPEAAAATTLKGRAVWASPRDAGTTEVSVVAFVGQLAKAHGGSAADMQAELEKVATRLKAYAPDLHDAIAAHLREPGSAETLAVKVDAFLARMPAGYAPPDRLTRTLETVRAQGVEGVVIFSTGGLTAGHLWEAVEAFFGR